MGMVVVICRRIHAPTLNNFCTTTEMFAGAPYTPLALQLGGVVVVVFFL